jgi:Spy/CpxP family protein refolding chaperone
MRWTISTLLALAIVAPAVAAPDGPDGRGGGPRHRQGAGRGFEQRSERQAAHLARVLGLTDEQRAAAEQLRADGLAAAKPKMQEIRQLRGEVKALMDAGSDDAEAVGARMITMRELKAALHAERQRFDEEFSKLLTDEQRFAWQALKESRGGRGRAGRRGGAGRRPGGFGGPPGGSPPVD